MYPLTLTIWAAVWNLTGVALILLAYFRKVPAIIGAVGFVFTFVGFSLWLLYHFG
jgi:hypothetical protein